MVAKPAVIQGCYVDCKFMPGLKSARISIDIPIEMSNEFLRMFGAPDRSNPVRVAVARLGVGAYAPQGPVAQLEEQGSSSAKVAGSSPAGPAKSDRTAFKDMPRSQRCALKCTDPDFQRWLGVDMTGTKDLRAVDATTLVKSRLGMLSRKELDTDNERAAAWDALLTDFEMREFAR